MMQLIEPAHDSMRRLYDAKEVTATDTDAMFFNKVYLLEKLFADEVRFIGLMVSSVPPLL